VISQEVSRLLARAAQARQIGYAERMRWADAAEGAMTYDDLPGWLKTLVSRARSA
jgi:hypothetical protein